MAIADRPWSLTRRMAVMFATTTCLILAGYGVWSGTFVLDILRDDVKAFLEHEVEELALLVERGGPDNRRIQLAVESIAAVTGEPPTAFRVRDADGVLLAEAGPGSLLGRIPDPIPLHGSWREHLFTEQIAVRAKAIGDTGLVAEVIADASGVEARVTRFFVSAGVSFLVAAALAALAGWLTASRGLASLHDMVEQASHAAGADRLPVIVLERAPTEVREVGQALNALLRRIESSMEDLRTFTAGLAHELRSPLQNLIGETEVTLMKLRDPAAYEMLLRSNLEDLYDLTDAVDNLVAWCHRSSPERHELRTEEFDLAREAHLRLARERRSAERAGVGIEFDADGDTVLAADREACLRVLRNLVGNAIVWSPPGSVVEVCVNGGEDHVDLVVMDRGAGIEEALAERVFEPFVSGRVRQGRRGGYGLGLAICRSVMEDHGGTLGHRPRPGGGTTFEARFPRHAPVPEPATA